MDPVGKNAAGGNGASSSSVGQTGNGGLSPEVQALLTALTNQLQSASIDPRKGQPFFLLYEREPLRGAVGDDVYEYFRNFEYLAGLVPGITDEIKLLELKKGLRDRALSIFMDGTVRETSTFADAKQFLLDKLVLPHQRTIFRQNFHARKKGESETVADYYRDLRRMADLAYASSSIEARELLVKERLIDGAAVIAKTDRNYKIWKAGYTHSGESLEGVIAAMQAAETVQNSVSLVPVMPSGTGEELHATVGRCLRTDMTGNGQMHRVYTVPGRTNGRGRGRPYTVAQGTTGTGMINSGRYVDGSFPYRCYSCQQVGHRRADCQYQRGQIPAVGRTESRRPIVGQSVRNSEQVRGWKNKPGSRAAPPVAQADRQIVPDVEYGESTGLEVVEDTEWIGADFEVRYRPGRNHTNVDTLSRVHMKAKVPPEIEKVLAEVDVSQWQERARWNEFAAEQRVDPLLQQRINFAEHGILPQNEHLARQFCMEKPRYAMRDGVLIHFSKWGKTSDPTVQLVVPRHMRLHILQQCHGDVFAAHFGIAKTFAKVSARYYWDGYFQEVEHFVRKCAECAKFKDTQRTARAPLQPMPFAGPWERVGVDLIGPLPATQRGNRFIIVFTDYFSRWVEAVALPDSAAVTVANAFLTEIVCRYGACGQLLSDKGPQFLSKVMEEVCRICDVKKSTTSGYHPQCNGLTERCNKTIGTMLGIYVTQRQKEWDNWIPFVLFAYRSSVQSTIGHSPYAVLFGREPRLPGELSVLPQDWQNQSQYSGSVANRLAVAKKIISSSLKEAQSRQKENFDRKAQAVSYKVNNLVWLKQERRGVGAKLKPKWNGPYIIVAMPSSVDIVIRRWNLPNEERKLVHVNRVKPCYAPWQEPPGFSDGETDEDWRGTDDGNGTESGGQPGRLDRSAEEILDAGPGNNTVVRTVTVSQHQVDGNAQQTGNTDVTRNLGREMEQRRRVLEISNTVEQSVDGNNGSGSAHHRDVGSTLSGDQAGSSGQETAQASSANSGSQENQDSAVRSNSRYSLRESIKAPVRYEDEYGGNAAVWTGGPRDEWKKRKRGGWCRVFRGRTLSSPGASCSEVTSRRYV